MSSGSCVSTQVLEEAQSFHEQNQPRTKPDPHYGMLRPGKPQRRKGETAFRGLWELRQLVSGFGSAQTVCLPLSGPTAVPETEEPDEALFCGV